MPTGSLVKKDGMIQERGKEVCLRGKVAGSRCRDCERRMLRMHSTAVKKCVWLARTWSLWCYLGVAWAEGEVVNVVFELRHYTRAAGPPNEATRTCMQIDRGPAG